MFTRKDGEPTPLDVAINNLLAHMSNTQQETKEYSAMADQLVKLVTLKETTNSKRRISPDTAALIAANLLGILLIINYERANIITSKALGFVSKLR